MHQLHQPWGVNYDESKNILYVADSLNHRIMRYLSNNSIGTRVAGGTSIGTSNTQLSYPYGFVLDLISNSLIIANAGQKDIVRWVLGESNWTSIVGVHGVQLATPTTFTEPVDVTLDPMGNIYVADNWSCRVQFFPVGELNGTTIAGVPNVKGSNATLFASLRALILDNQLNLYVADENNHRIQKFLRY